MQVSVRLFGTLPRHYPGNYPDCGLQAEVPKGITVVQLVETMQIPREHVAIVAVNGRVAGPDDTVPENAEIQFFQGLHGG